MRADLFDHAVILSMPEYHPWREKGSFWGGEVLMMSFSPSRTPTLRSLSFSDDRFRRYIPHGQVTGYSCP